MEENDRIALIRRGNELFNNGDIKNALKIFLATSYQDGIVRVADHLFYEENNKIAAIKLYKKAGYQKRIDEFAEKAALTIRIWLESDKIATTDETSETDVSEEKIGEVKKWEPVEFKAEDIVKQRMEGKDIDTKKNKKK
jgi:hypothetical protein